MLRRTTGVLVCSFIVHLATAASAAPPGTLWEGRIDCPNQQPLQVQLLVVPGRTEARATLVVVSQGFATDVTMTQSGNELTVSGPVPGNVPPVTLRGQVVGNEWQFVMHQGPLRCAGLATRAAAIDGRFVAISPAYQATPMWCWLTVGEMIFRHFAITQPQGNSGMNQCAIMQTVYQGSPQYNQCAQNCMACAQLGAHSSREFAGMLTDLPRRLAVTQHRAVPRLFVATSAVLPANDVKAELEADRPVAIGISPSNMPNPQQMNLFFTPQHVALIVGMVESKGIVWYRVNDPFPFHLFGMPPPYVTAGGIYQINVVPPAASVAYWIKEADLKTKLRWSESFLVRQEGQHQPSR
jgi:hypothetical protein